MNLKELKEKLEYYKVPEEWYCLGGEAQYCYCLNFEDGRWILYSLDRGKKNIRFASESEDEACSRLLELMLNRLARKKKQFENRQ